jgi:hypothetical protein
MADPLAGGQKRKLSKAPPSRQAFLSGEDMRKVFLAAGTMEAPAGPLIQFMMLTALRRNEAACTKWSEFGDHLAKLEIPAGRMKGGERAHLHWIPIAPQVGELLAALERHEGSDLVFTYTGQRAAVGFHRFKLQLDRDLARAGAAGAPEFRFHDFRRSFVMWAMENDEAFPFDAGDIADRCLGHETFNKVKRTYNPYAFQKERRELLATWADYLITGALPRKSEAPKPEASDIVDVKFEVVQPRQLPGPKPAARSELSEQVNKRVGNFLHDAFFGLLFVVTHPEVPSAIQSMLGRGASFYTKEFLEKGPPMNEAGRFVAQYALEQAVMVAYRCFKDPTLNKVERAQAVQKAIKENLAQVYVKDADTIATKLANAAIDAGLTRWPLRSRKGAGSTPESTPGSEASAKSAA